MNKQFISTQVSCRDDYNNIWLYQNETNALYVWDIDNQLLKFITVFDKEPLFEPYLFSDVIYRNKKLYFIPDYSKYFVIYDICTCEVEYVNFECENKNKKGWWFNVVRVGENKLVLLPSEMEIFYYIFDLELNVIKQRMINLKNGPDLSNRYIILSGRINSDMKIIFCEKGTKKGFALRYEDGNIDTFDFSNLDDIYEIILEKQWVYAYVISKNEHKLFRANIHDLDFGELVFTCIFENKDTLFRIAVKDEMIVGVPFMGDGNVIFFDGMKKEIFIEDRNRDTKGKMKYFRCEFVDDKIALPPLEVKYGLIYDIKTGESDYITLCETEDDRKKRCDLIKAREKELKTKIINEKSLLLSDFIEVI